MRKFLLGIYFLLACTSVQAFDIPENKNQFILDQAGIFSETEEVQLLSQIREIEKLTTAEIAVFTFLNLEGRDISELAVEVGRAWGVGKKENDNGVIFLIAKNNRKWFIATGYGVEGVLPDILAKRVGERNFPVNFRKGDYFEGVARSIEDIGKLLQSDESVVAKYKNVDRDQYMGLLLFLMFAFSIFGKAWVKSEEKNQGQRAIFLSAIFGIISYVVVLIIPISIFFSIFLLVSLLGESNGKSGGFGGGGFSSGGGSFGGGSFGGGGGGGSW